jgi:hypothetical protein
MAAATGGTDDAGDTRGHTQWRCGAQGVLGEKRLHRVWERQTEALADARAHAWDPKDYTPATDPLGLIERGVDMPAAHEYGGFWRVGACDAYGWGDATDARINADPVQRLWQRCSAMEIDGRGLKDKNGTWVTSDAGGAKKTGEARAEGIMAGAVAHGVPAPEASLHARSGDGRIPGRA